MSLHLTPGACMECFLHAWDQHVAVNYNIKTHNPQRQAFYTFQKVFKKSEYRWEGRISIFADNKPQKMPEIYISEKAG